VDRRNQHQVTSRRPDRGQGELAVVQRQRRFASLRDDLRPPLTQADVEQGRWLSGRQFRSGQARLSGQLSDYLQQPNPTERDADSAIHA
jgi:hypothetical protein